MNSKPETILKEPCGVERGAWIFDRHIIFIIYRPEERGIRRNISFSDDISLGLKPSGNIITSGNISPNPPSGGSINDILYRKNKMFMQNIKK